VTRHPSRADVKATPTDAFANGDPHDHPHPRRYRREP
jgi:hypothetical protein